MASEFEFNPRVEISKLNNSGIDVHVASNSQVASEKSTILSALSCTKDVWLLNRYLNMSLTANSGVRKQDGYKVLGGVGRNTIGRSLTWDFVRENWDTIKTQ